MAQTVPDALVVLSTMITPAILILATSSLITATSSRLSRVLERVRHLSDLLRAGGHAPDAKKSFLAQIESNVSRVHLMQRAMTRLYLALTLFILTSFMIGVTLWSKSYTFVPLAIAFFGILGLLDASIRLIIESRKALTVVETEMAFVRQSLGK